jgi:hypothetical protein
MRRRLQRPNIEQAHAKQEPPGALMIALAFIVIGVVALIVINTMRSDRARARGDSSTADGGSAWSSDGSSSHGSRASADCADSSADSGDCGGGGDSGGGSD